MPIKATKLVGLSPRMSREVPLLDEPPLGHLQAIILKKLDDLGDEAFGYNVLEQLSIESAVWMDHAQIYSSIRRLLDKELIALVAKRHQRRGPPLKIYKLTAAGRVALKSTTAHYRAVAEYLDDKNKRKATRT
jgi:DNA-binding PadR family transcriptional regulator